MTSRTLLVGAAVAAGAAFLLVGCAVTPVVETPRASSQPVAPSATPTPTAEEPARLIVTAEGVEYEHDGQSEIVTFAAPESLLDLIGELAEDAPESEEVEGPYGSDGGTRYEWNGVSLLVPEEGPARIRVTASAVAGVGIQTAEGIAVGSDRDAALAAGAWDDYDEDADGVAEYLGLGGTEVPDTQSLTRQGEVGIVYVLLAMDDDVVDEIQSPANDFSDI